MSTKSRARALVFGILTLLVAQPFLPAALAATDLCQGLVQDKVAHPMTALAKPAVGQVVIDPQFGTKIRRITAVNTAEGSNAIIKPMYATMQAWNADESKLILWHRGKGHELYDGKTYQFIRLLPISPTDIEHVLWDPVDPDALYYPSGYNALPRFYRYKVSTNTSTLIHDFATAPTSCPVDWGKLLQIGRDPQYMSWGPTKVVGLQCGYTKFLYDIAANSVLAVKTFTTDNAPITAPSGTLNYFEGKVLDMGLNLLRTLNMASTAEHASAGRGLAGDTYNAVGFDDAQPGTIISHNMATGAKTVIVGPAKGWPYPPTGTHISAIAHKTVGWVGASIVGDPAGQCILCQEIILANTDNGTVCRVAHHRSVGPEGTKWGYWGEPHLVVSPTGTRILFGSDWQSSDSVDSYVVELPSYTGGSTSGVDLAVTQTDSPDPLVLGNDVTYSITVTNQGTAPASGVRLTETLASGINVLSSGPAAFNCTSVGNTISCNLGNLAAGASTSMAIVASPISAGSFTAQASVSANETDANSANNSASQTTTAQPGISIGDVSVTEGNSGTVNAVFTVTLSAANAQTVNVSWATANGTAAAGSDYVAGSGTLSFPAGTTSKTITVAVNGDTTSEPDETFFVNLTNPQAGVLSDSQGKGTIVNDDAATTTPSLSVSDVRVTEGNSGTLAAVFNVTLSATSTQTVTVNYATANGTAAAGTDYLAASGTLSFAPGTTVKTISVTVNGDTTVEPDETFLVNLSAASGATLADSQGVGTIANDDSAGSTKAVLQTPVPGSTLPGSTVTFIWSAGTGATAYWLEVGSTVGAHNLYPGASTTALQTTVSGLPTNGSTVYVRLWSLLSGTWVYNDYTYKASGSGGTSGKAVMQTPVPGSTLPGSTVTFAWSAASGASGYWLEVGTSVGGHQTSAGAQITGLSTTVTGIPTNSSTVYVRLWTLSGGTWVYNDYSYRAAGSSGTSSKAVLQTPAPGSTLAGSTVTFGWSAGTGVSSYWLEVGTSAGAHNLYAGATTTARQATVSGLPTNGSTVYVRLWSLISGTWVYNDYSYKAAGSSGTSSKAVLQTPVPGSTLAGSTVTFAWTAGTGVTSYWLEVGTSAGAHNLYTGSNTTARQATVSSLPTNGSTVYVRLWSLISGAWVYNDYTYKAATI
jgi:uncharacterized repeat protein (TIGR01451 family)